MALVEVMASGTMTINAGAAHDQVFAFHHFRQRAGDAESPVEAEETQKMQAAIKESVKAEHPAELNQPVPAGDFAQGRHRHRQHQKNQRHHAGRQDEEILRIRAELVMRLIPHQQRQRHQAVDQNQQLDEADVVFFHAGSEIRAQIHPGV